MPEQTAFSELALSIAFKRCQRVLAQMLELPQAAPAPPIAIRRMLQRLSAAEQVHLGRWLNWLAYAASSNGNPALAGRIGWLGAMLPSTAATWTPEDAAGAHLAAADATLLQRSA